MLERHVDGRAAIHGHADALVADRHDIDTPDVEHRIAELRLCDDEGLFADDNADGADGFGLIYRCQRLLWAGSGFWA